MPAFAVLGIVNQFLQLLAGDLTLLFRGLFVDEVMMLGGVAGAEEQETFTGKTVSACPSGFLVITLNILGEVVMNDKANIRFVDAHAEGDGGTDDLAIITDKGFLVS